MRGALQSATRAFFTSIAYAVAKQMIFIELCIRISSNIQLTMIDVIDITQLIGAFIGGATCITNEGYVIFFDAGVVSFNCPVAFTGARGPL